MLRFEKLTMHDVPEVLKISESQFGAKGWQVDLFKSELEQENHFAYVAKMENEVVSFIIFMKTFGVLGEDINIMNIATKKGFENQGIGTEVFNFLFNFAKNLNIKLLWLEVREGNSNAIRFYSNLGFKTDYIRKGYYSDGENALVMSCKIFE